MAKIEERILTMRFDNAQFKAAAADTTKSLQDLKKNMRLDGVKSGINDVSKVANSSFSNINKSAGQVNLKPIVKSVDEVKNSFSAMGAISFGAFASIGAGAVSKVAGTIKGLVSKVMDPIVQGGMNRARNLEQANFTLQGVLKGDAEATAAVMADANAAVDGTAYGLDQAAKAAAQFAASGMRGGVELQTALKGIVGVASVTNSEFDDIANIFTTVRGQGKLMTEQLNMIASRGINAAASLAESLGVTEDEVRNMTSKGKIDFDTFAKAMSDAFGDQATKANETYSGSLSNMRAALGRIGADVAVVHLRNMRDMFNALRPAINEVRKILQPFIGLINDRMTKSFQAVIRPIDAFTAALKSFNDTGDAGSSGWNRLFKTFQDIGMILGLVADVARDAVAVIFGASPRFIEMSDTATSAGTKIQHIFRKLLSVFMLVPEVIGMIIKAIFGVGKESGSALDAVLSFIDGIASFLYLTAEVIRKSTILQTVIGLIGLAFQRIVRIIGLVGTAIAFLIGKAVEFANLGMPLFDKLFAGVSKIKGVITDFLGVLNGFKVEAFAKIGSVLTKAFNSIGKTFKKFDFKEIWESLINFKIPKLNMSGLTIFNKTMESITNTFQKLKSFVSDIDWSPLTNIFTKMEMPKLGDVSAMFGSIGSSVKTGFSNLNFDSIKNLGSAVKTGFVSGFEYLRNFDYVGMWSTVTAKVSTGARNVASALKGFTKWIVDAVQRIDWAAVGQSLLNGLTTAVKMTAKAVDAIGTFITDMFTKAVDAVDWDGMFSRVKDFGTNLFDGVKDALGLAKKESERPIGNLDNVDVIANTNVSVELPPKENVIDKAKAWVVDIWNSIRSLATDLDFGAIDFGWLKTLGTFIKNPFKSVLDGIAGDVKSFPNNVMASFTEGAMGLTDGLNGVTDAVSALQAENVASILSGFGAALSGIGVLSAGVGFKGLAESMTEIPKSISGLVNSVSAIPQSIAGVFGSVKGHIEGLTEVAKTEAKGNFLLKLAGSIAIIAAALWVLAKLPVPELQAGLLTVGLIIATLVGSLLLMDKAISEDSAAKLETLSKAMMQIGIAIGVIGAAIWILGKMDPAEILAGLAAVVLTIASLAGGIALAGLAKNIAGVGTAFLGLALGVAILAGAFLLFKMINWAEMTKGLITLGVSLLAIATAARIADGKKLAGAGMAMLGLGTGLLALAYGIRAIAAIDLVSLLKGLVVLGALMAGLTAMTKFGRKFKSTATALVGIAVALVAMAYAIKIIAEVDFLAAAGGMAIIVAGMYGLGRALKAFPKKMPALAGSLMAIAGAIAILIAAVWIIGNMDLGTIVKGVGTLGVVLGGLIFAISKLPPNATATVVGMSVGLLAISASLLVLAYAMKYLEGVSWESLGKAGAIVAGLIAALAGLGAVGLFLGEGLGVLGLALIAIGAGLLVMAGAAWVFADAISKVVDSVSNFVDSLTKLANSGDKIKFALQEAGKGISLFAQEAGDGLRELLDIIKDTGAINTGALALLFSSFNNIPTDIDARMSGFVAGIVKIEEIVPALENIIRMAGQIDTGFLGIGSDNKALSGFFKAFDGIPNDLSGRAQGFVDTMNVLGESEEAMNKVRHFSTIIGDGFLGIGSDNKALGHFFEVFDNIPTDLESRTHGFIDAMNTLAGADEAMNKVRAFSSVIGDGFLGLGGDTSALGHFFKIFEDIPKDVTERVNNFVTAMGPMSEATSAMNEVRAFSAVIGTGFMGWGDDTQTLGEFFQIFNEIPADANEKITNFSSAIMALGEAKDAMYNVTDFSSMIGTGFWGIGDDNATLGNFFQVFNNIPSDAGSRIQGFANGVSRLSELKPAFETIKTLGEGDTKKVTNFFESLSSSISADVGTNMTNMASGVSALNKSIPALSNAISKIQNMDTGSLSNIMSDIASAFNSGVSDSLSTAADAIRNAVESMLTAASDRTDAFRSAGEGIGSNFVKGVDGKQGDAEGAGESLAKSAASGARDGRSDMVSAGEYVGAGLAVGIRNSKRTVIDAANELANAASAAAKANLKIKSPSRLFMEFGQFVSQGFAIGITKDSDLAKDAIVDSMDKSIKVMDGKTETLKGSSKGFFDTLIGEFNNNPMTKRLEQLAKHSKAQHATLVKERKIEAQEKLERAEEERKKIYKEVEEAREAVGEAKEATAEAKDEAKKAEKSTKDATKDSAKAAKDAQKQKQNITDAEERYQKAIRDRDKYEYRMYGEEAGVAFVDGVAEGLMDDTEAIPSIAEILAELLLGEVKTMQTKVDDYSNIFSGFQKTLNTTKSMGDHVRDLTRAFNRLENATSPRSIQRNIDKILGSIVGFMGGIKELLGVLSILEPFLPSLLGMFEASLPAIMAVVAPFAPELAATLGGGLTAALPAILGPAAAIIGAIAGIGLFLINQANGGSILKGLKKMFNGVIKFMVSLPKKILGVIQTMIKGLIQTIKDIPMLITMLINGMVDLFVGLIEAIPDVIPELVDSMLEAFAWIIFNAPAMFLEIGTAIVLGLIRGIEKGISSLFRLLLSPLDWLTGKIGKKLDLFQMGKDAIQSFGQGLTKAVRASTKLVLLPFEWLLNKIGSIFGFNDIGTKFVNGFAETIINAMKFAVDAIAFPFIGLYNLIATIFGWEKLAYNAASSFIFGTSKGIQDGTDKVISSTDRMTKMMNEYLNRGNKNNLADIKSYIDQYMKLVADGMVDGIELGADSTRKVADKVWKDIESVFNMYGLGKDELDALTEAFYSGTTNPDTIVSSFNKVFARIQQILDMNGVGGEMVGDLDASLIEAIRQGMLDEAMKEFGDAGYQSGKALTDSMVKAMGLSESEIRSASDNVWANIEAAFDFLGLGNEGLEELKQAYQEGTRDPDTYVSSFNQVFDSIERKLRLAGMGEEQIKALRYSMVTAITTDLNPKVSAGVDDTKDIFDNTFSSSNGKDLGRGIVEGIMEGIAAPFKFVFGKALELGTGIIGAITGGLGNLFNFGASIGTKVLGGLKSVWDGDGGVLRIGADFVGGIIQGISNKIGGFLDSVKNLGLTALDKLRDVLRIFSPSRETAEIGGYLVAGLTKGVTDNANDASGAMSDMGEDILTVARQIVEDLAATMDSDTDMTITPVIDLSEAKKGINEIGSLVRDNTLSLDSALSGTSDIASAIADEEPTGGSVTYVTNVEFNQTNTSPEPLSAYEIYQNTDRSLTSLKLRDSDR